MNIEQKRQALGKRIRAVRETGRVGVGIDDLGRIADALGSPVRDLLTF